MARKPQHSAETARKIWLAGIGAYGRAFSEAQESIAKLTDESARVFDDLVAKGEAIEKKVEAQGRKVAAQVAPGAHSLDDRIKKMRERIGLGAALTEDHSLLTEEVRELRARVERLEALLVQPAAKPKKRKAAKKKSA